MQLPPTEILTPPALHTPRVTQVEELCAAATAEVGADKDIKIANYLCPGNYAVSGSVEGCEAVEKLAKSFKARMTVRLAVAGGGGMGHMLHGTCWMACAA